MKRLLLLLLTAVTCVTSYATDYKLVTSPNDLVVGAKYIVVGLKAKTSEAYAMGTLKSTNHYANAVTITNNVVSVGDQSSVEDAKKVVAFELVASGNDSYPFAFKSELTGKYLNAPGGTKDNHLKEVAEIIDNAMASIAIDESNGVSSIKFNGEGRVNLRFNSSASPVLFSCYATGQNDVYLYKEVTEPPTPQGYNVYFQNTASWNAVYAYAWKDGATTEDKNADWPGEKLELLNLTPVSPYVYNVKGDWDKIIFNDGVSAQTANLTLVPDRTYSPTSIDMPEKVFVIGNLNGVTGEWNPTKGLEMIAIPDYQGVYIINDLKIENSNNGYGYFAFATQLGQNETDWELGTRFGASTADEETGDQMQNNVVIGTNSWKIPAGYYQIILDLNNMKVSVTKSTALHVENISGLANVAFNTEVPVESPAVAIAQQGKYLWITDGTGNMLIYGDLKDTFENGDGIAAGYKGNYVNYSGLTELTDPTNVIKTEKQTAVEPAKITLSEFANQPLHAYVEVEGKVEGSGRDYTITDVTGMTVAIRTTATNVSVTTGDKVLVRGFRSVYEKNGEATIQLSPVYSEEIVIPAPAAPVFSITGGTVDAGTEVTITCATEGAKIMYRLGDGEYSEYTAPIVINESVTVFAKAVKDGVESEETTHEFVVRLVVPAPVFSITGGTVDAGTEVAISCELEGATIMYRLGDGEYSEYTAPIVLNESVTVFAKAVKDGVESEVTSHEFVVRPLIPAPSFYPQPGAVMNEGDYIEIYKPDYTVDGKLYYRIDSQEGSEFVEYTGRIDVTQDIAISAKVVYTDGTESQIGSAKYAVQQFHKIYLKGDIAADAYWEPLNAGLDQERNADGKFVFEKVKFTEAAVKDGYAYFSIVTSLDAQDWTELNDNYRYGPMTDGDVLATGETVKFAKCNANNATAWKLAPGNYNITVDMAARTIYAEKIIPAVAVPVLSIESGAEIFEGKKITITCETEGAEIYYYLHRGAQTEWVKYTDAISVGPNDNAISAKAVKDGNESEEVVAKFQVVSLPERIYIKGGIEGCDWNPIENGWPIEKNADGKYVLNEVTFYPTATMESYFALFTTLGTQDWDELNSHRYGPATFNEELVAGTVGNVVKCGIGKDYSWKIANGTYRITVDLIAETILAEAVEPTIETPVKLYLLGDVNFTNWSTQGVEMHKTADGVFQLDRVVLRNADRMPEFAFSGANSNNEDWDKVNAKRFGPAEPTVITATQIGQPFTFGKSKTNNFSVDNGLYSITVNFNDKTVTVSRALAPENLYVFGDIERHKQDPYYTGAKMAYNGESLYSIKGIHLTEGGANVMFGLSSFVAPADMEKFDAQVYIYDHTIGYAHNAMDLIDSDTEKKGVYTADAVEGKVNFWFIPAGIYDIDFDIEKMQIKVKTSDSQTVYVQTNIAEPYLYAYTESETRGAANENAPWPGQKLTPSMINNEGVYVCVLPKDLKNIEINDGTKPSYSAPAGADRTYSENFYILGDYELPATSCAFDVVAASGGKAHLEKTVLLEAGSYQFSSGTFNPQTATVFDTFGPEYPGTPMEIGENSKNKVVAGSKNRWTIGKQVNLKITMSPDCSYFTAIDQNATGIEDIDIDASGASYYNIQGVKFDKAQKGLNIIRRNGKTIKQAVR